MNFAKNVVIQDAIGIFICERGGVEFVLGNLDEANDGEEDSEGVRENVPN